MSTVSSKDGFLQKWSSWDYRPWIVPPIAAGVSIIPAFHFFAQKSAEQMKGLTPIKKAVVQKPVQPNPLFESMKKRVQKGASDNYIISTMRKAVLESGKMVCPPFQKGSAKVFARFPVMRVFFEAMKGGFKATPTISCIVGTQLVAQNKVEEIITKQFETMNGEPSLKVMVISSMVVGLVSSPLLAIFNSQTQGETLRESLKLKGFTPKLAGIIAGKETIFVLLIRANDPVTKAAKKRFGNNKPVEWGTILFNSIVAGNLSQPLDTAAILEQNGIKLDSFNRAMKGGGYRALGLTVFGITYKESKDYLYSRKHA